MAASDGGVAPLSRPAAARCHRLHRSALPVSPSPRPSPLKGEGARASVHLTLVFGRSDFRCMARDRARPRTQVLYTSLSGAGEIFDGWRGSQRGRDPEHTPSYVRSHALAGDHARREKIPAPYPPLKPCTFVHNRVHPLGKPCKRRESAKGW